MSKFTAHLRLTVDFDIISGLLHFTLTTINPFSFLLCLFNRNRVLPPPFLYHIRNVATNINITTGILLSTI